MGRTVLGRVSRCPCPVTWVASTARRLVLHLPKHWPCAPAWQDLWANSHHLTTRPNLPRRGTPPCKNRTDPAYRSTHSLTVVYEH